MLERRRNFCRYKLAFLLIIFLPVAYNQAFIAAADLQAVPYKQDKPSSVYRVLLLQSYHIGMTWAQDIAAGVQAVLNEADINVNLHIEYMDTKRISDPEHFGNLRDLYRHKFEPDTFDLVITADDDALNFVLDNRDALFLGVPVVFCGVNRYTKALLEGHDAVTGVTEKTDHLKTINLALTLQPEAEHIYVINDQSTTGQDLRAQVERAIDRLIRDVEIHFLDQFSISELEAFLREISPHDIVYLMTYHQDIKGNTFTSEEIMRRVDKVSVAPVYATGKEYLGLGIVGGYLNWGYTQGATAADLGLLILKGEAPGEIPVITQSPAPPMFDYRQVQKWQIPVGSLPPDTVFVNRPESFYEKYPGLVWATALSFAGLVAIIVLLTTNIYQRQRAEAALRRSEERLHQITENINEVFFIRSSPDGQIEYISPAYENLWGRSAEVLYDNAEAFFDTVHPDDVPRIREITQKSDAVKGDDISNVVVSEYRIIRPDGEMRWIQTRSFLLLNEDDVVYRVIGVSEDITERKRAESELARYREHLEELVEARTVELQQANKRLMALSRAKDDFVSNVSHELRTPITSLKLHLDLMRLNPGKSEVYLERLTRETKRLENIIEDLLCLSRLDQDRTELSLKLVNLNKLAQEYVIDRTPLAKKRELELSFMPMPDLPQVQADEGLWGQALSILLTNALNYTPTGGRVEVRIQANTWNGRSWAGISVIDTGPGIPIDEKARLFERFFRGSVGRSSNTPGTGLGLAITREIVEKHQGRIEVHSPGPGEGATFSLWLPVVKSREYD